MTSQWALEVRKSFLIDFTFHRELAAKAHCCKGKNIFTIPWLPCDGICQFIVFKIICHPFESLTRQSQPESLSISMTCIKYQPERVECVCIKDIWESFLWQILCCINDVSLVLNCSNLETPPPSAPSATDLPTAGRFPQVPSWIWQTWTTVANQLQRMFFF